MTRSCAGTSWLISSVDGRFSLSLAKWRVFHRERRTKDDAIELLDELGNAEQASLTRMSACMFDFRLGDNGQIELAGIGEAAEEYIMETCYPELQKALSAAEGDDSDDSQRQIRGAVERERTRLGDDQPPATPAATQLGRDTQKQLGAPS